MITLSSSSEHFVQMTLIITLRVISLHVWFFLRLVQLDLGHSIRKKEITHCATRRISVVVVVKERELEAFRWIYWEETKRKKAMEHKQMTSGRHGNVDEQQSRWLSRPKMIEHWRITRHADDTKQTKTKCSMLSSCLINISLCMHVGILNQSNKRINRSIEATMLFNLYSLPSNVTRPSLSESIAAKALAMAESSWLVFEW